MKCPACSANLPDNSTDCPGCGVNLEKWRSRGAVPAQPAPSAPAQQDYSQDSGGIFSDLPVFKIVLACLFAAGLYLCGKAYNKYLPGGLADLAKPGDIKKDPKTPAAASAPQAPAAPAGPQLSMAGFDNIYRQYSAQAEQFRVPLSEYYARQYFQYGVDAALGMNFDGMEEAGLKPPEIPFTEDEKNRDKKESLAAKCSGDNGIEYLPGLPPDNSKYNTCWVRTSGRVKSTRDILVISSPIFPHNAWAQAQWLPNSKRWSPWTDSQQAEAAQYWADKYYGPAAIQDELQKAEKVYADIMKAGENTANLASPLVETYKIRFHREGLLAGADLLRRR